mmetsp:Transcript_25401/g.45865  ORF Transcript_25401/g.45865 Transcript_25401/m.45865 type:complete len:387 (+) Transcript_25401:130-1290(+)|eukprot:CAMPEP_0201939604 /NCGR_PEP_ID=MMETSP0903-20130614/43530_1 /ASSEMBLY_ACC=CAM_ASM_000552 /TAXON_ID=420261 /ORGANISM="Thalassiosira antarctica, Strain CCMP982" /LENGTH=386 /DNA_ID=CAMNT_0048481185 /DNA_START=65 /DNA_END=1225 /DNA_ORIENTATION=+
MSEFRPLSMSPESDYTISSMDDVSLSSSRNNHSSRHSNYNNNNPLSSGSASVSSKFSRVSTRNKSMKNGDLGMPLTSSLDERDENGRDGDWVGASAGSTTNNNGTTTTTTKSYISEDDPFYMFRGDLVQKLTSVDSELNRYLTVVRTTDTAANTHQVKETKKQLKRHIKHAESTLSDLETTVRVVERQREKFPHINDAEIMERRGFVDDSKSRILGAKGEMQSEEMKQKFLRDERALTERRRGNKNTAITGGGGGSNGTKRQEYTNIQSDLEEGNRASSTAAAASSSDPARSETLLMMQQQDETLEDLDMAVTRVGYMAETIHEEIDTQNAMLESLGEDLADAEEQLGVVMGKLAKLLKTKSKCQIGLIVILSLVVLILFFLVVYT